MKTDTAYQKIFMNKKKGKEEVREGRMKVSHLSIIILPPPATSMATILTWFNFYIFLLSRPSILRYTYIP